MLFKNGICMFVASILVVSLVSCGGNSPELSQRFEGEHYSINYSEDWEIVEEEFNTKIVYEGTMLQLDIFEDEAVVLGDLSSIESLIKATIIESENNTNEEVFLPKTIDVAELENQGTLSLWVEIKTDEGRGMYVFVPIDGATYMLQLQPGKYKNQDYETVRLMLYSFEPKIFTWMATEEPPVEWTLETFANDFWSIQYLSNWEIEKTEESTEFFDENGDRLLSIKLVDHPVATPEDNDSILGYVKEVSGIITTQPADVGLFAFVSGGDETNRRYFHAPFKGRVFEVLTTEFIDIETANTILTSVTYDVDKDTGVSIIEKPDDDPVEKPVIDDNSNTNNNQDSTNNSNSEVKKGKVVDKDEYSTTLPSGWTLNDETEMVSFINPPDTSSGTFMTIEVQPAEPYKIYTLLKIYEMFKDGIDGVSNPIDVKLGDKDDALQYTITDNGTSQVFTIYKNDNYYYTIKLIVGDTNYSAEYSAFLKWFKAK